MYLSPFLSEPLHVRTLDTCQSVLSVSVICVHEPVGGDQLLWQKMGVTLKAVWLGSIVWFWVHWLNMDSELAVEREQLQNH